MEIYNIDIPFKVSFHVITFINKSFKQKIHGMASAHNCSLEAGIACLLEKRVPDSPGTGHGFQASRGCRCNDKSRTLKNYMAPGSVALP